MNQTFKEEMTSSADTIYQGMIDYSEYENRKSTLKFGIDNLLPEGWCVKSHKNGPSLQGYIPHLKKMLGGHWLNLNNLKHPFNYDRIAMMTSLIFQIYSLEDGTFIQFNKSGDSRILQNPNHVVMSYIGFLYQMGVWGGIESFTKFFDARMWTTKNNNFITNPKERKYLKMNAHEWTSKLETYKFNKSSGVEERIMMTVNRKTHTYGISRVKIKVNWKSIEFKIGKMVKNLIERAFIINSGFLPTSEIKNSYIQCGVFGNDISDEKMLLHFDSVLKEYNFTSQPTRMRMSGKKVRGRQLYKKVVTIMSEEVITQHSILDE